MTILEMRKAVGMTQKQFADFFHISWRTIQNWENGVSSCPSWLPELLEYRLRGEMLLKD